MCICMFVKFTLGSDRGNSMYDIEFTAFRLFSRYLHGTQCNLTHVGITFIYI